MTTLVKTDPADDAQFLALWDLAWQGSLEHPAPSPVKGSDDSVTRAINSAPGKLAEALLSRLWRRQLARGTGFPDDLTPRLLGLVNGEKSAHHMARIILASRLFSIHFLNPEWAKQEIITRMHYPNPTVGTAEDRAAKQREATELWTGYAWSPRIGPSLLEDLKEALKSAAPHLSEIPDRFRTQLVYAISEIASEAPDAIGELTLRAIFASFSESELIDCAEHYRMKLEAAEKRAYDLWNKSLKGVFQQYWPVVTTLVTGDTSRSLGRMLLATRDAFPEALDVLTGAGLLTSIQDPSLILAILSKPERFEQKKDKTPEDEERVPYDTAERHPEATLLFLDKIIGENIEDWARTELGLVLAKLRGKQAGFDRNPVYQRLYRISRHG
jgi:hypothetical protein